jgi:O-antigen/teichoic acid export membrane protein
LVKLSIASIKHSIKTHSGAISYTLSSVSKSFAQLLTGLLIARFIAPGELGLWNSVSLATTYAFFVQAGIINGLSRDLPFHLGAGDSARAEKLAATAQLFTVLGCLFVIVCGGAALLFYRSAGYIVLISIIAIALITAFTFYQNYLMVTFRSKDSFAALAKVQFWSVLLMFLTLPALYFWHYDGMLLRAALITGGGVLLLHLVRPMKVGLTWDWGAFRDLMKIGLPIFALAYLESTAGTVDRIVLLSKGGIEQVGYYSFALLAFGAFGIIPISLASYIYPRMTYSFGKERDPLALWTAAWRWTLVIILIMLPIAICGSICIPFIVPRLFPQYSAGVSAAQILLFGAVFYGGAIGVNALWSMKAWKFMVAYQVTGSLLRVAGPFVGVLICSSPLLGVSYGMAAAYGVTCCAGLVLTYLGTHQEFSEQPLTQTC